MTGLKCDQCEKEHFGLTDNGCQGTAQYSVDAIFLFHKRAKVPLPGKEYYINAKTQPCMKFLGVSFVLSYLHDMIVECDCRFWCMRFTHWSLLGVWLHESQRIKVGIMPLRQYCIRQDENLHKSIAWCKWNQAHPEGGATGGFCPGPQVQKGPGAHERFRQHADNLFPLCFK